MKLGNGQRMNNLIILTEDSPQSFSPSGERIHHLARAASLDFNRVVVLALGGTRQNGEVVGIESRFSLYTVNFSRAMPFPLTAFDPVKMLIFLVHGMVLSRRIKPTCLVTSMPPLETGASAWLISRILRLQLVVDLRDDWESAVGSQLKRYFPTMLIQILSSVAKKVYSSALAIFVVTKTIGDTTRKRGIQTPILVVPNGADTNVFQSQPVKVRTTLRKECCLPPNKVIAVYGGSGDNPYYRLDQVLSSITLLPQNSLERLFFVFYVYNGVKYLEELKRKLGISDDQIEIRNPLPRNQLARVLSACDIGLVPFDAKSYLLCARSTKIYEYLSAGLFVIGSGPAGGELDSFFSDNPDLGVFTSPSASNFAHILLQVAAKHEDLLGDDSRKLRHEFIRKNYDRQRMIQRALSTLFDTTKKGEKSP